MKSKVTYTAARWRAVRPYLHVMRAFGVWDDYHGIDMHFTAPLHDNISCLDFVVLSVDRI